MGDYPRFYIWAGRDIYSSQGMSLHLIALPWPKAEQETGYLIRALVNLSVRVWPWGIEVRRYCPNRAEYWLRNQATDTRP